MSNLNPGLSKRSWKSYQIFLEKFFLDIFKHCCLCSGVQLSVQSATSAQQGHSVVLMAQDLGPNTGSEPKPAAAPHPRLLLLSSMGIPWWQEQLQLWPISYKLNVWPWRVTWWLSGVSCLSGGNLDKKAGAKELAMLLFCKWVNGVV